MTDITIWHNPRCSKSRSALGLLQARGIEPLQIKYLDTPPSEADIRHVLSSLNIEAVGLMRRGETLFRELGLSADTSQDALITAMARNPILIERPVIISGDKAVIGRPPEAVLELL